MKLSAKVAVSAECSCKGERHQKNFEKNTCLKTAKTSEKPDNVEFLKAE